MLQCLLHLMLIRDTEEGTNAQRQNKGTEETMVWRVPPREQNQCVIRELTYHKVKILQCLLQKYCSITIDRFIPK